jgi:diguanylate cyclase (GGDEF)-like protein
LYAADESIEFGFMYDNLVDETFSKYHEYDIFSSPSGEITTVKNSGEIYTSIRISGTELSTAANNSGNEDINIVFGSKEFIIFTELDLLVNDAFQSILTLHITISIVSLILALVITRLIDESVYLRQENIKRMKYDSTHDLLTSLPNRKNIYEQIQYQINRNRKFAILFIDFDGFKNINDQFGHDTGDDALIQGSLRMKNSIRMDDVLARIGGDEFIIVLKDLSDPVIVSSICEKLIASFSESFDLSGNIATMGVSIGAYINYDSALSLEEIISNSDKAMYQVKNSGKNNYSIFNDIKGK